MNISSIRQFALDHVPGRSDLESAVIEYAGLRRGLSVARVSRSSVTVDIEGASIPFNGLHGPDTSYMAKQLGQDENAQRALAECWGVLMTGSDVDEPEELVGLFVIDGYCISAVRVERAFVVGNGRSSIGELIRAKNEERTVHPYGRSDPVPEELNMLDELGTSGRDLGFVPAQGEQVILRSIRDKGVDIVDITDTVDSSVMSLAVDAVGLMPGLSYAGVEIGLSGDAQKVQLRRVLCPASAIAHFPTSGQARDVAGGIIEHYVSNPRWQRARREKG